MARYINANPYAENHLDFLRTNSGWSAHFFAMPLGKVDALVRANVERARAISHNGIAALEALGRDLTKSDPLKNECAAILFRNNIAVEIGACAARIKAHAEKERDSAYSAATQVLESNGNASLMQEIRQFVASRRNDAEFVSELRQMVKADVDVARAIVGGKPFLLGMSNDRFQSLSLDALMDHAPDACERFMHYSAVRTEADKMDEPRRLDRIVVVVEAGQSLAQAASAAGVAVADCVGIPAAALD